MIKRILGIILVLTVVFCAISAIPASAASDVTIKTNLEDGALLKGSKKTFEVIARDADGNKVDSSATLNGEPIPLEWDDDVKTSFKLTFTKEGENEIIITAGGATKTLNVTYQKAQAGDVIGQATYCVELFTLGHNYLIEPTLVDIKEGENAAQALKTFIESNGYAIDYTGTIEDTFYLSGVESDTNVLDVPLAHNCPEYILELLSEKGFWPDDERWDADWLGEFDYTFGSGWMYAVNGTFANVGFGNYYLSDGDVVRVQFTLCYGPDIGDNMMGGEPVYLVENRDKLTALIAEINSSIVNDNANVIAAKEEAFATVSTLNCSAEDISAAYNALNDVYVAEKKIAENTEIKHEDTETGTSLEAADGVFPKNTQLKIEKANDDINKAVTTALNGKVDNFVAFDITATCQNVAVQPNGKVKATFKIPEKFDLNRVAVVYIDDKGGIKELTAVIDKVSKTVLVELEHFSTYAIVEKTEKKNETVKPSDTKTEIKTETTDKTNENASPKTGDSVVWYIAISTLSFMICVALLVSRKNKNEI